MSEITTLDAEPTPVVENVNLARLFTVVPLMFKVAPFEPVYRLLPTALLAIAPLIVIEPVVAAVTFVNSSVPPAITPDAPPACDLCKNNS